MSPRRLDVACSTCEEIPKALRTFTVPSFEHKTGVDQESNLGQKKDVYGGRDARLA